MNNAALKKSYILINPIQIENPLHKHSEKAIMCFYARRVRTRDFTVIEICFNEDKSTFLIRNC